MNKSINKTLVPSNKVETIKTNNYVTCKIDGESFRSLRAGLYYHGMLDHYQIIRRMLKTESKIKYNKLIIELERY